MPGMSVLHRNDMTAFEPDALKAAFEYGRHVVTKRLADCIFDSDLSHSTTPTTISSSNPHYNPTRPAKTFAMVVLPAPDFPKRTVIQGFSI